MDTVLKRLVSVVLVVLLAACASANFYPFEGDNVRVGKGGTRFVVDGIDVWFNGEPPRKYAILGYIEDPVSTGVDESHTSISSDVLKKAKEVGATALIEAVTQTPTSSSSVSTGGMFGSRGSGFGLGLGFGFPLSDRVTIKYTAVKYLD